MRMGSGILSESAESQQEQQQRKLSASLCGDHIWMGRSIPPDCHWNHWPPLDILPGLTLAFISFVT